MLDIKKDLEEMDKIYKLYCNSVDETNEKLDELSKKIDKFLEGWESKK